MIPWKSKHGWKCKYKLDWVRRVRDLRVMCRKDGVILQGSARTYHAKQLAQHSVMEITDLPILANEIEVQ